MKKEPFDYSNISVRRSARLQNNAQVDLLVKIEDQEEEKTRLKRRLRQPATSATSIVTDGTNSIEETLEPDREVDSCYCKTCNYTYETRKVYLTHQNQVHWDEIPKNYCNFCKYTFSSKYMHLTHLNKAHGITIHLLQRIKIRNHDVIPNIFDPNHFCNACEHTFYSKNSYRSHLKMVHAIDLSKELKIIKSSRVPDINDPNKFCSVCDHTFTRRSSYRNHLFYFHAIVVPKRSQAKKVLYPDKTPDISDPNYFCNACDRTFASRNTYHRHLQSIHAIRTKCDTADRIPEIDIVNNFCNVCDRTYSTTCIYRHHLENKHAIKIPRKYRLKTKICYPNRIPNINDPNNFCNMCDHTFCSKATYHGHLSNIHTIKVSTKNRLMPKIRYPNRVPDADDYNNYCSACDYTFSSKNGYFYHLINKHSMEVPTKSRLKIKTRYPDRVPDINDTNHFCSPCDYTFSSKVSYHNHLTHIHFIKPPKKLSVQTKIVSSYNLRCRLSK